MNDRPQAAAIAAAVAGRDRVRLAAAVTDTVRLRALLPGGPIEEHGRVAVVARVGGWFAGMDTAGHWLHWRRRHQARSRWYHQRARLARDAGITLAG